jgi:hypothetical protein
MEPEDSLPSSQQSSTSHYPELNQLSPSYLSKIQFNIVYPSTSWST